MRLLLGPVRWWVRIYTAGLPPMIRDERRAEVESDLWEQSTFEEDRSDLLRTAISMWSRWLFGVVDDLVWMSEQRAEARATSRVSRVPSRDDMSEMKGRLLGIGLGVAIALALVTAIVIVNTFAYLEGAQPAGEAAATLLALALAMAFLGIVMTSRGLRIIRERPIEGALLVVGGSSVAGFAWYWLFIPVMLSVSTSVYGIVRAVRLIDTRRDA